MNNSARHSTSAEAESVFRKLQHTLPFRLLLKAFLLATKYLPVLLMRAAGIVVVIFFIILSRKNYRAIMKNLRRIRPGISGFRSALMAFDVFRHYSWYLIDLFYISHDIRRIDSYSITITGLDNLKAALDMKKGIILLTTHLGNWEIGGLRLTAMDREIHVAYSPDSSPLLEVQRSFIRNAPGIREIALREGGFSSLKLLRLLQDGKILALQGDRLLFDRGITVPFFGHNATLPKGPVKLALAAGAIILPVFIPITGMKSYEIIIEEPVVMEQLPSAAEEIETNINKIIKILEKNIGRYPEQWYTFMPFWEKDKETLTP